MARPMLLVQEDILSDIWFKHTQGVPILALIRQENLPITSPTLTVLLGYMTALEAAEQSRNTEVYATIYASLFPAWLANDDEEIKPPSVMQQPKSWFYTGKMPLGKWVQR